jgi:hypothetical protein
VAEGGRQVVSNPFMRPQMRDMSPSMGQGAQMMTSPGKAMSPRISLASPTPFFRGEASPYQLPQSPVVRSQASPQVVRMTSAPASSSPAVVRMSSSPPLTDSVRSVKPLETGLPAPQSARGPSPAAVTQEPQPFAHGWLSPRASWPANLGSPFRFPSGSPEPVFRAPPPLGLDPPPPLGLDPPPPLGAYPMPMPNLFSPVILGNP